MDRKLEIQLGTFKSVNSINVENYDKIELKNKNNEILEYDIRNILNVTEVYEKERQNTEVYRIYGGIDWLSILNGMPKNYTYLKDIFTHGYCLLGHNSCDYKNIYDSFDFYLLKPSEVTKISGDGITYSRQFEVIATPENFEITNAGYSKNIYGDQKYSFIFNEDFNIYGITDAFGFPITELYLHPRYNRSNDEEVYQYNWDITTGDKSIESYGMDKLNMGDLVYGDIIEYSKRTFEQYIGDNQEYLIKIPYDDNGVIKKIRFKYNPFIPIKLRYFANEIKRANTGTTSYDQETNIPYYATNLGNGNMIWRDILPQGYIDPLSGNGVDFPFVNKKRYCFNNIIIEVIPDLSHNNTANVFRNINFDNPEIIDSIPQNNSDLDNIGKPCQ